MKIHRVKIIVLTGIIAFVGIIVIQIYWLRKGFDYEEKKFSQNIQVSLLDVVNEINRHYGYKMPLTNPIQQLSGNYYVVNVRNDFDARILEFYLTNTFIKRGIGIDYEYAIYDCETDDMVYGSYVNMDKTKAKKISNFFPKAHNLVYYFAIRFPQKTNYIFASLQLWVILFVFMVIVLLIYLYSIYVILQQKKYADLQRDFINNMTHEFKTPLSSILIASGYLAKQPSILADPKLEKYTRIVMEQGKKLDGHIEKILNLAKSDNAPGTLNKSAIKMNELILSAIGVIQLKYPTVITRFEPAKENIIMADAFHFANIVYNILENAVKYCDRPPFLQITLTENKDLLHLDFIDNGIGITAADLPHVFEKFYRVPGKKKDEVNGFGLGLFYVQKICRLHKWKLNIASNTGTGTIVTLIIKK
ncbi:MAG: HAMP domain-containing sensor histidine kinase [Ferruginibacter sp.]